MSNVVEFPYGEISNPLANSDNEIFAHVYDTVQITVDHFADLGYDVLDEQMQNDLGVLTNLMFAVLKRQSGEHHMLHNTLDILHNELNEIRKTLGDTN